MKIKDLEIQYPYADPVGIPTPPAGFKAVFIDTTNGNVLSCKDPSGTVSVVGAPAAAVFGTEAHDAKDDSTSVYNGNALTTKLIMTTAALPAGRYRIGWSYQWRLKDDKNSFKGQVLLDNTILLSDQCQEPKDKGADQAQNYAGHDTLDLTAGVHTIAVLFAQDGTGAQGNKDAAIWNTRLELWRVS